MKQQRHSAMIQAWADMKDEKRAERLKREGKLKLPTFDRPPPAMSKDQRKALVEKVTPILATWQSSRFQHEAACRHGVRMALCLDGVSWPRADMESEMIVSAGLNAIGATIRPTWQQGQPELIGAYENCIHCGGELDEEQIGHGDRFCSLECVKGHRERSATRDGERYADVTKAARRMVTLSRRPTLTCECCQKKFKKRGNDGNGRFCSVQCAAIAKRSIPELVCENPACGKTYKTHAYYQDHKHHYCSSACAHADRDRWAPVYKGECQLCGKPFEKKAKAKFCSSNCSTRDWQYRSGRVVPTRVTPTVFDFFIKAPAEAALPKWLSPARFDELVAA